MLVDISKEVVMKKNEYEIFSPFSADEKEVLIKEQRNSEERKR